MFTKRLCALLLALVLSIGVMLPAQARGVEYNLDEAIEALRGYLEGYTDYSIDSIVSWIQRCEGRWSRELEEYAICLQEIEAENFMNIRGRIYDLNTERFRAFLEEKELSSLADIQTYADARQAECDGDIERAILLYEASEVCDSSSRRLDLQRSLKQDKYDEAMAGFNSNTYEGAKLAAELFAELAQSYYSNSGDMARQAEAKREELRSISVTVNESLNGRNFTMAVTADGAWTVSNDASWLELSRTSGTGNATITATMEENRTSDDRTATLTFRCGNKTETKSIWQEKTDWIIATQSGSTIRVEANGRWTAVEEADWLTLSKTSGTGNGSITLRMEDNVGSSARTADVYFTCGSASTSVSIRQEKKDVLTASIVGTRINLESNGSWTATDDASWLTLSKTRGNGDDTITIAAETNTTSSARTATITFRCGVETKTLTFRQEKTDHITVSVSGSGNTRTINVTANGSWTVAENSNWLTLSRTSGSGNASITATLEPNTTTTAREAIMTFTCGSDTERVTIEQQKVDTLDVSVSGSGNIRTITVTSNGIWTATENSSWLTLRKTSGSGNALITVALETNSGASRRTATVTFTCGSVTKSVNITQDAASSSVPSYTVTSEGSYGFALNSNGYYESQNKGRHSTTAACVVTITGTRTAYLDVINYAESGYDYGTIYAVDSRTNKLRELKDSSYNKFTVQTLTITLPDTGAHTLYITFKKDGSSHQNNDSLQFKVRFSGSVSAAPTFSVASEGSYGFVLNSNGYYESQNKGHHSTTAACVVMITGTRTAYLDVINYAESGYDYGTIYAVDSRTNKLHELNSSSYNKSAVQTFTITLPDTGTHTLYITFKKDHSMDANNDSLQFKVRFPGSASAEPTFSVASEGSYGFALNSNGYYESQNKGRNDTTAACTVTISGARTAYLDVINYAEAGWDYGTIYAVDSRTNKLRELKDSSYNKSTVQTFTITLPDTGAHTLYITFKKDSSAHQNNDSLQFKVRFSGEASTGSATTSRNFSISGVTKNSNGTVTVRWTDSANNGPYTLHYKQRSSGSWTQDRNSNFRYWNASEVGSVTSKSATLMRLVPGYSYWIIVRDSDGEEAVYEYIAGTAPNFTEYGNTLAITIKRKSNGATVDLREYSASDIAANMATKEYFAYIRLDYSQLARAREYHGVMAIRDPRGQVIADNVATFNFNAGNYYTYWGNYGLEWYFGKVKDSYGSIPTGTYTMYLYLDGKFATSDTFTVGN